MTRADQAWSDIRDRLGEYSSLGLARDLEVEWFSFGLTSMNDPVQVLNAAKSAPTWGQGESAAEEGLGAGLPFSNLVLLWVAMISKRAVEHLTGKRSGLVKLAAACFSIPFRLNLTRVGSQVLEAARQEN
jgi:hypothetical protein